MATLTVTLVCGAEIRGWTGTPPEVGNLVWCRICKENQKVVDAYEEMEPEQ